MKVKSLPRKDIDVEICDIYEDREAVIIQHTDTLVANTAYNVEALGFKYNLKPCAFHWPYGGIQGNELKEIHKTGVIKFGVYIPTDRYRSLSRADYLPDYTNNKITTQLSADYYGKRIGDSKPARVQQGQDLFDYTDGVKGYDIVNGINGSEGNMDFIREMEYVDKWYLDNFNRLPSSGSDRQGVIGSKEIYMPFYLGIRKTTPNIQNFDYKNIDRLDFIHREITSRYEYGFENNLPMRKRMLKESIELAIQNKGMFNDFSHWHRAITHGNNIQLLEELYRDIHEATKDSYIWSTGYSEAVEYYWYRKMTKRVRGSFINGSLYLVVDFDDELIDSLFSNIKGSVLYDRIFQSLSVKIDLKNTEFSGNDISSDYCEIIKLKDDEYILNLPFFNYNGLKDYVIYKTEKPNYKTFEKPEIIDISGGIVKLNVNCKLSVFEGDFNSKVECVFRDNKESLEFKLDFNLSGKMLGITDEFGNSSLIEL